MGIKATSGALVRKADYCCGYATRYGLAFGGVVARVGTKKMKLPRFTSTSIWNIVLGFVVALGFLGSAWKVWDMAWFNYTDTFAAGAFAGTLVTLAVFLLSDMAACIRDRIRERR